MRNLLNSFRSHEKKPSSIDPSEFTSDQERRKIFLQYINRGWLSFGIVAILTLPIFPTKQKEFGFVIVTTLSTYLITSLVLRFGKIRLAGLIFSLSVNFSFYALFIVLVYQMGADEAFNSQASVWMVMGLAVLFAGAFVDKWAAPALALINTILLISTRLALAPGSDARPSILVFWWMMALTIWLYEGTLHSALNLSWSELNKRKGVENEMRGSERYFAQLNQITQNILTLRNLETVYQTLARDLAKLFESSDCYIERWDEEKQQTILLASTAQHPYSSSNLMPGEVMITTSIMRTAEVVAVDDTLNSINAGLFQRFSIRSLLGVPLIVAEHKIGVVLITFSTQYHFSTEEIARAEQAGKQIALALWTVQQEAEIQKRLRESNALTKIMQTLSETERIGLQTVLQLIVTSAKELIPTTEQAVIHLLDEDQQILKAEAVIGYAGSFENRKLRKIHPNEGVAGQVIVSGKTLNIADVTADSRFLTSASIPSYRSLMVAPVQSGERKLGTISVQSSLVSAFTEDENRLLSALGTQAAVAIENAHMLEDIQQTLKEVNALYGVTQELVASLETNKLLQDTVELLQKNFGYYHVQIYILEPESGDIVLSGGSGEIGKQLKEAGHRLHAGDGIIGYVAETSESFFTNDVDQVYFFVRNPYLPDTKSELAVPVKISGNILGVLDIQQVPPGYLTQRDIQLVSAVADQLAVALQKANLYEELQTSLQQEKAIRSQLVQNERLAVMGRLLASVSHELNNPLQAIQNALFLLKEEKDISAQGKQDLDIVLAESERMANMIEQLRATYRPIQTEDFRLTQINNIVEDVHTLISPHLRHNQVAFEFHPNPEIPPILAHSDQIRQVILNLFINAVEAMTEGGTLTIDTDLLEDTNEVLLTVSDTGTGISLSILPNIFEAFITDKQKGTGLGLTITYDIVIKHRGRITAENNADHGSTFKVWLPIKNREIE